MQLEVDSVVKDSIDSIKIVQLKNVYNVVNTVTKTIKKKKWKTYSTKMVKESITACRSSPGVKPMDYKIQAVADAVAKVHQGLHSKGQLRVGVPVDPKLPDAGENVQRLEINDLPQKARWAVTNRTNIAKVLEQTGASITTKGTLSSKMDGYLVLESRSYIFWLRVKLLYRLRMR